MPYLAWRLHSLRHKGSVRPAAELLELAQKEKWQQCPKCRCMVARTGGCNHMVRCCVEWFS